MMEQDSGFRVELSELRMYGIGFEVQDVGVHGAGFRIEMRVPPRIISSRPPELCEYRWQRANPAQRDSLALASKWKF